VARTPCSETLTNPGAVLMIGALGAVAVLVLGEEDTAEDPVGGAFEEPPQPVAASSIELAAATAANARRAGVTRTR